MINAVAVAAGIYFLCAVCLYVFQRRMIYVPHRYPTGYREGLPDGIVEITYTTPSSGPQVAFYLPPRTDNDRSDGGNSLPDQLWMVFSGNSSMALNWLDLATQYPNGRTAFFLFDYPGYGANEGRPTRASIRDSAEAAWKALAARLNTNSRDLESRLCILGHSLGTATGLEFAAAHPPQRIVLVAPFTSLLDMARRSVGLPLAWLAKDRFDNRARFDELAAIPVPPAVTIIHGTDDNVVPYRMGRELAERHPDFVSLITIPGGDHNQILDSARIEIYRAMSGEFPESSARPAR